MIKVICDRCERDFKQLGEHTRRHIKVMYEANCIKEFDLCADCIKGFDGYIQDYLDEVYKP